MAEELKVNIIGDASKLKGALGEAGSQVTGFSEKIGKIGKTMTIVGGIVTAALGAIVMKTAAVGDKFDKMSLRTGISVEALSSLAYAADISGTSIETMEKGLKGLTKTMDDASMGIGEGLEAFELLDIAVVDTEGNLRSTVDVLKEAATKISAIENPTKQAALAMDLFGAKAGPQLLPLLKAGGAGIEELMKKADALGITMSTKAAAAAAEFQDRLTDLKSSIAGLGRGIGEILIPPLTELAEKAVEIIKKIKSWADAHKPLMEMIVKVGAVLGVLAMVGGPILMAVSAFMKMKGAIVAIGGALKVLGGLAATNPIGMVIFAAGALYLAWQTNFGGIKDFTIAIVEKVKEALGWLWDKVKWVLEKLGLYEEVAQPIIKSTDEIQEVMGIAATSADTFAKANDGLGESLDKIPEKAKTAGEAIKIYAKDVGENYIALSVAATKSWEAFYDFWEAEAKRTAKVVQETIDSVKPKKMYKIVDAEGNIIRITDVNQISSAEADAGVTIESFQKGTPYVSKTGLALIHEGERVVPKEENKTYNQQRTYSPTVNITVQGNGDTSEIKRVVEQALEESARQYNRRGYELVPGMG